MKFFLLLVAILLTGCVAPLPATPPPTSQVVEAVITPALRPLHPALNACARAHPDIGLFLEEAPAGSLDLQPGQLAFRLGEPPGELRFAVPLGMEEIAVILNEANPVTSISTREMEELFTGAVSSWEEFTGSNLPVEVWRYPEGDEVGSAFQAAVHPGRPVSPHAHLAPDPQAMLEAVQAQPGAIGYLPVAWLAGNEAPAGVKTAQLEPELAEDLRLPVLALAEEPPGEAAQDFLACLQGEEGRRQMEGIYAPWTS